MRLTSEWSTWLASAYRQQGMNAWVDVGVKLCCLFSHLYLYFPPPERCPVRRLRVVQVHTVVERLAGCLLALRSSWQGAQWIDNGEPVAALT